MNNSNASAANNLIGSHVAGALQARVSVHWQAVNTAAFSYQNNINLNDHNANFASPTANNVVGDLVSVGFPMGSRNRLEVISTFAQLLVSYDARLDVLVNPHPSTRTTVMLMQRVQSAFNSVGTDGLPPPSSSFTSYADIREVILLPVWDAMAITDIAFARDFASELLDYFWVKDFGMRHWGLLIRYALHIPMRLHHTIEDSLLPLTRAAFNAVVLIDDCFGYDLDLRVTSSPVNIIAVAQWLNPGLSPPAVKSMVLMYITRAEGMFRDSKTRWEQDHFAENDSHDIHARNYLQGLYDFVAGYHAWARTCPRYNF